MAEKFLGQAYTLESPQQTKLLYRHWAASYDEEITANGYASPTRTAQALLQSGARLDAPLLDIGCGTGVSGLFLREVGFTDLHGSDFSQEMLVLAEQKAIYTELHQSDLHTPFDFVGSAFDTIAAVGVLAPGHAGPELIATVIDLLAPSGLFGFSLNDHTLENPDYLAEIERLVKQKRARIRWQDYGDHLPKINVNSMIVVLQRDY